MKIKRILIGFCFLFLSFQAFAAQIDTKQGTVYYTPAITKAEASSLMDYLTKNGFFPEGRKLEFVLDKVDGAYAFKIPVKKGLETDSEYIGICKQTSKSLSKDVFHGKQVDVHLLDSNAKTLRVVVGF